MNLLIVIPARGGSKGIPLKNIYPVDGKPLLEYTLEVIEAAHLADADTAVSTDAEAIKSVAGAYPWVHLIDRPTDIAGDTASTESALLHALSWMRERSGRTYDAVMTLQATSPLRKPETLRQFIAQYERDYPTYDALLSLTESRADYWIQTAGGSYERLQKDAPRRRQGRKPLFIENSAYYLTETKALEETQSVLGHHVNGFVIAEEEGIDINEPIDIRIAEAFLRARR